MHAPTALTPKWQQNVSEQASGLARQHHVSSLMAFAS